jgi:NAD(P)-dependent dehydrogenase (short-subunit alcohol dehydrogenase family)
MAAGKPRSEVEAILARGRAIAERLAAAGTRLAAAIDAVLTPAQRAWLAACLRPPMPTAEQRQQLAALQARFVAANEADLAAIERAMTQVRALRGTSQGRPDAATEQKIAALLAEIRPAMARVAAAREALDREIRTILGTTACR